jgi:hypothetical protein
MKPNQSEGTMNDETGMNSARRYPLSLALRYVVAGRAAAARNGVGETVWMSGGEVAFLAAEPACVGDKVALYIDWPVLLQGEVSLQLIVAAEVVQRAGQLSIAKMTKHEFRTRGVQSAALSRRLDPPFSGWETHTARHIPAAKTVEIGWRRLPAVASAAGG